MYQYDDYDRALVRERVAQFRDQVQRRLAAYGAYNGNIDGIFGPATARAVQFFHRRSSRSSADALDWFVDDLRREVPNGG